MIIKEKIKQIFCKEITTRNKQEKSFYNLSETCQIPNLCKIYEQYFGKITCGIFVEVGAYDGDYVSNTSGLADIGWVGYYIEPVPEYFNKCKKRHAENANIIVSNYAIGEKSAEGEIFIGGPLSTISPKNKDNFESLSWARNNFNGKKNRCTQKTLDEYLQENTVNANFELLVIDVEGLEWKVLQGFKIQKWLPQMIVIELHDQNDDYKSIREECNKIVSYFDENKYKVIFKDYTNTIYVPKNSFPKQYK